MTQNPVFGTTEWPYLLTVAQVAHMLGISEATIRRRFDDGTLHGIKLGSTRRIYASEINRVFVEGWEEGERV